MKILLKEHYSVKIYKEKQGLDEDEYSLSLDSFALLEKGISKIFMINFAKKEWTL